MPRFKDLVNIGSTPKAAAPPKAKVKPTLKPLPVATVQKQESKPLKFAHLIGIGVPAHTETDQERNEREAKRLADAALRSAKRGVRL